MEEYPKEFTRDVAQALLAPFEATEIKSRQQGGRQMPYVDSRTVQRRLDEVVGPGGWAFDYEVLRLTEDHVAVKGTLTVLGVSKSEAGEQVGKEKQAGEERVKAAVSDSLKRAAVHFGVGRLLYRLDSGSPNEQQVRDAARKAGWVEPPQVLVCARRECGAVVDPEDADRTMRYFKKILCQVHEEQLANHLQSQREAALQEPQQTRQDDAGAVPGPSGDQMPSNGGNEPATGVCAGCGAPVPPGQAKATVRLYKQPFCSKCLPAAERKLKNKIAASPAV